MRRKIVIASLLLVLVFAGAVAFLIRKMPFRREQVIRDVQSGAGVRLEIGDFQETWFPPGFTAGRVRLSGNNGEVMTVGRFELRSSYTGLLGRTKNISHIRASGIHLTLPPGGVAGLMQDIRGRGGQGNGFTIGELRVDNAGIEVRPGRVFDIHRLILKNAGPGEHTRFEIAMRNPVPSGEIRSTGEFGPFHMGQAAQTPLSGTFTFEHADIGTRRVSGILDAKGKFKGVLSRVECSGTAEVPRFQVKGSSHTEDLHAEFQGTVDGRNGDSYLTPVNVRFNRTAVMTTVKVAASDNGRGKTVTVDAAIRQGRVEDVLGIFTKAATPGMTGGIALRALFVIPPGPPGFLTRLRVDGEFAIVGGEFTNPKAQSPVDKLSASAAGEPKSAVKQDPGVATAQIRGQVTARDGTARLLRVQFTTAGIEGQGTGTFRLTDTALNLEGRFDTTGELSDATSGVKALFVKVITPLWHKKGKVKSVPFKITGTAGHPVFRVELHR